MTRHTEIAFEQVITLHLLDQGYEAIAPTAYDVERAIFPETVIAFIRDTQPKEWARLQNLHTANTESVVLADLVKWLEMHGTLSVLRNGFKCYGRTLRMAYFQPPHRMNPELAARYAQNILGATRQLHYSLRTPNKSVDLVLSINGLPVITAELKNPMTGQTVKHAVHQYRHDRDQHEVLFEFKRGAVVHFAVDPEQVMMTTRLAKDATVFLPFDRGNDGGAGNPPDPDGRSYRTAYLFTEVWQRDSLLDLFARFLHLQIDERRDEEGRRVKKETMVFPRYHQLQATRQLEAAARTEGPGQNYLIEHSAGSGKSNTIGWLAHRLASLHDEKDEKVFDSVIVITDRRVLDKQLQETIYQFEHRQGVVQRIDEDSKQLAESLTTGIPIVITTLQKFPFVARHLAKMAEETGAGDEWLPRRTFAVIIDEAHSSQSGESATEVKSVLAGEVIREAAAKQAEEEGRTDLDALFRSMAKRGKQANLSFFAFTATPKHKTLKVFGREVGGKGGQPFHRYTMRQAIEEGFILDVLKNYTTYKAYYKLLKACETDPNVERKAAAKELSRFLRFHPVNISQKTSIMVEHFRSVTKHRIGGRAKAMVVTGSRLEAVRYKEQFDKQIRERGYHDIKTLVAFSGTVQDDKVPGKTYTEVGMNGGKIKESDLPEQFASNEYQVLLVAEKYQTGFDQPLLHTMYVDKRLSGIQAVQTLSRLNRTHPIKEETFVLDFVNERDEIQKSFAAYFDGAELGEEVDAARLYEVQGRLDAAAIYLPEEVLRFSGVFFKPKERQSFADHQAMNAALDPAVDRFKALQLEDEPAAELWRSNLVAFRNLYAFLSQVIPYQDSDLERLYTFVRHLGPKLPRRERAEQYHFDDDVRLEYYRLQMISDGSIGVRDSGNVKLDGPKEVGSGQVRDERVALSKLVNLINDRFGTDFNDADQLFFDQIVQVAADDETLRAAAVANSEDKFGLLVASMLQTLFMERIEQNSDIFARYMNDAKFQKMVSGWVASEVWQRHQKESPEGAHTKE